MPHKNYFIHQFWEQEEKERKERELNNNITRVNNQIQSALRHFGEKNIDEKYFGTEWEERGKRILAQSKLFPLSYLNNFESADVALFSLEFGFYMLNNVDVGNKKMVIYNELFNAKQSLQMLANQPLSKKLADYERQFLNNKKRNIY